MGSFREANKNIGISYADGHIGKAMIHAKDGNNRGVVEEVLMEKSLNPQRLPSITLVRTLSAFSAGTARPFICADPPNNCGINPINMQYVRCILR